MILSRNKKKEAEKVEKQSSNSAQQNNDPNNEDWDYDFSMYETTEAEEKDTPSIHKDNKPTQSSIKAKWSPHNLELERLEQVKLRISQLSMKVAANTQDLKDLWDFYGALDEYWASIHDLYGTIIIAEVKDMKETIIKKLMLAEKRPDSINYDLHRNLLFFRDKMYMLAQRKRLAFDIEIGFGQTSAERGMIQ